MASAPITSTFYAQAASLGEAVFLNAAWSAARENRWDAMAPMMDFLEASGREISLITLGKKLAIEPGSPVLYGMTHVVSKALSIADDPEQRPIPQEEKLAFLTRFLAVTDRALADDPSWCSGIKNALLLQMAQDVRDPALHRLLLDDLGDDYKQPKISISPFQIAIVHDKPEAALVFLPRVQEPELKDLVRDFVERDKRGHIDLGAVHNLDFSPFFKGLRFKSESEPDAVMDVIDGIGTRLVTAFAAKHAVLDRFDEFLIAFGIEHMGKRFRPSYDDEASTTFRTRFAESPWADRLTQRFERFAENPSWTRVPTKEGGDPTKPNGPLYHHIEAEFLSRALQHANLPMLGLAMPMLRAAAHDDQAPSFHEAVGPVAGLDTMGSYARRLKLTLDALMDAGHDVDRLRPGVPGVLQTPMHACAARGDNLQITLPLMLDLGGNPNQLNAEGRRPVDGVPDKADGNAELWGSIVRSHSARSQAMQLLGSGLRNLVSP